jgi:hypothetical protein
LPRNGGKTAAACGGVLFVFGAFGNGGCAVIYHKDTDGVAIRPRSACGAELRQNLIDACAEPYRYRSVVVRQMITLIVARYEGGHGCKGNYCKKNCSHFCFYYLLHNYLLSSFFPFSRRPA